MKYRDKKDIKKIDLKLIEKKFELKSNSSNEYIKNKNKIELENKIFKSKNYNFFRIIKYFNRDNIVLEFLNTGFQTISNMSSIKLGNVKDYYFKNYYNEGFLGYGEFLTRKDKKTTIEFRLWSNLLSRCYNKKILEYKYYGAKGIFVCERWKNFQNFSKDLKKLKNYDKWIKEQYNYNLDKDLLSDENNKIYSPETCCFITKKENIGEKNKRNCGYKIIFNNKKYKSLRDCEKDTGLSRFLIKKKLKELENIS